MRIAIGRASPEEAAKAHVGQRSSERLIHYFKPAPGLIPPNCQAVSIFGCLSVPRSLLRQEKGKKSAYK